jgi:hypothetical protein
MRKKYKLFIITSFAGIPAVCIMDELVEVWSHDL